MRVRTKICVFVVLLISSAAVFYSYILWADRAVSKEYQRQEIAEAIIKTVFELNVILGDYVAQPTSRSIEQWQLKHDKLEQLISTSLFNHHSYEKERIEKIRRNSVILDSNLKDAIELDRKIKTIESSDEAESIRRWTVGQILEVSRAIVDDSLILIEGLAVSVSDIRTDVKNTFLAILVSYLLLGILGSRMLIKGISVPLDQLAGLANKVSSGVFDANTERSLTSRQDEFGQVGLVFKNMVDNLKESDRIKNEFISTASHQLRTPVSGLSWIIEALESSSKNLDPKQISYIKDLSVMSKRLIALVEDLLNFSRIELKKEIMTEKQQIEMSGFLDEFIIEMGTYLSSKKHKIILKKEFTEPVSVVINKRALYNVLQNLLSNAVDYSPENTAVTVVLEKAGAFIKISISNKGPAIPKEDQSRIFERFYRSEEAKKIKPEGTGLGLYIVRAIIKNIGGNAGFQSEEGKDTVFWFTIPLKNL